MTTKCRQINFHSVIQTFQLTHSILEVVDHFSVFARHIDGSRIDKVLFLHADPIQDDRVQIHRILIRHHLTSGKTRNFGFGTIFTGKTCLERVVAGIEYQRTDLVWILCL